MPVTRQYLLRLWVKGGEHFTGCSFSREIAVSTFHSGIWRNTVVGMDRGGDRLAMMLEVYRLDIIRTFGDDDHLCPVFTA